MVCNNINFGAYSDEPDTMCDFTSMKIHLEQHEYGCSKRIMLCDVWLFGTYMFTKRPEEF